LFAKSKPESSQAQAAREYQVTENTISKWRKQHRKYNDRAFAGRGHAYTDEARVAELERMVGRLTMENDLFKKNSCRKLNEAT